MFICTALQSCISQSKNIKVYGYKQAVSAGKPSTYETDESGKRVGQANRRRVNYYIYMSHPAGMPVRPVEVWINGEVFDLQNEVVNSPVEKALDSSPFEKEKVVLVPKTPGKVWMLTPITKTDSLFKLKNVQVAKKNEVVVVYLHNNRLFTKELKVLNVLRTEVMQ